jgi:hypothetical protein
MAASDLVVARRVATVASSAAVGGMAVASTESI